MKANRAFATADNAVADVLGSILLVAITVAMMTGLAITVLSINGPSDKAHADVHFEVAPGAATWGTGDEVIRMSHRGGESIPTSSLRLVFSIGAATFEYGPSDFDGDLADGKFSIGDSWSRLHLIQENDVVKGTAIFDGRSVITRATVRDNGLGALCNPDVNEPSVFSWTQQPNDLTSLSNQAVTVAISLIDDCSGMEDTVVPTLEYWLDAEPQATTNMTLTGPGQWAGTIPQPFPGGWSGATGKTLHYSVSGYADKAGNSGTTAVQNDLISVGDPNQYVASYTASQGDVTDFSNAQEDNGFWATLAEGSGEYIFYAQDSTGAGVTDHADARHAPNASYAQMADASDRVTTFDFDITGAAGTIVDVEMVLVTQALSLSPNDNDQLDLSTVIAGVTSSNFASHNPAFGVTEYSVSIYNKHPDLVTGWGWSDVQQLQLQAEYNKLQVQDSFAIELDAMYLRVTTAGASNSLDVEFQWTSLSPLPTQTLEIRHQTIDDSFDVQVWNHSNFTWATRGTLGNASWATWSYELTNAESSSGPEIRFVDTSGAAPAGTLNIDYARVVAS